MFKRRDARGFWSNLREFFAPRSGWKRAMGYYSHRMRRLPDTPQRIAMGFACGVYVSFTPFFGLHFVIAAILAWSFRGNIFASAVGTFVGNPLTFPFIAAASLELGSFYFGVPIHAEFQELGLRAMMIHLLENIHTLVVPYFLGGIVPGVLTAVASFYIVRPLVERYQAARRTRLVERAKARIAAEAREP